MSNVNTYQNIFFFKYLPGDMTVEFTLLATQFQWSTPNRSQLRDIGLCCPIPFAIWGCGMWSWIKIRRTIWPICPVHGWCIICYLFWNLGWVLTNWTLFSLSHCSMLLLSCLLGRLAFCSWLSQLLKIHALSMDPSCWQFWADG